jgi:hypothetical protein
MAQNGGQTDANQAAAEGRAAHQQNISCIFPFFTSSGKRTATVFHDDSIRSRSGGKAEAVKC